MCLRVSMLLALLFAAIPAMSQDDPPDTLLPPPSYSVFLGTWEMGLHGRQVITVRLVETGGKIIGVMTQSHFLLDHDGNVVKVTAPPTEYRVNEVKVDGRTLFFTAESRNSGTVENFEMTLGNDANGTVRRMAPKGAVADNSKTWKVRKVSPD